jgi:hypothetical protein
MTSSKYVWGKSDSLPGELRPLVRWIDGVPRLVGIVFPRPDSPSAASEGSVVEDSKHSTDLEERGPRMPFEQFQPAQ